MSWVHALSMQLKSPVAWLLILNGLVRAAVYHDIRMGLANKPIITRCGVRIAQRVTKRVYPKESLNDVEGWVTHDSRQQPLWRCDLGWGL